MNSAAPDPGYRRRDVQPHRGNVLLAIGILAFLVLGLILGPAVVFMARRDLKKMERGEMDPNGRRTTKSARDVGISAFVIWGLVFLGIVWMATWELLLKRWR